jgi:hypothetical protein
MVKAVVLIVIVALLTFGEGRALSARESNPSIGDAHGRQFVYPYSELEEGQRGSYVFPRKTKLRGRIIPKGTRAVAEVRKNQRGRLTLFTVEPLITASGTIPGGTSILFR